MAANEILFKALPFRPGSEQVFYIENAYCAEVNDFIRSNYFDLKVMFMRRGMEFCYLPYLLREEDVEARLRYYAPYLTHKQLVEQVRSDAFVSFIANVKQRASLQPSLLFAAQPSGWEGDVVFRVVALTEIDLSAENALDEVIRSVQFAREGFYPGAYERFCLSESGSPDDDCCAMLSLMTDEASEERSSCIKEQVQMEPTCSAGPSKSKGKKMLRSLVSRLRRDDEKTKEEQEEEQSLAETEKVLRELRMTVQRLRLEGVSLMAIHEFIDKQEPLSPMVITEDYRIFLPEYGNMEIEMGALPKAIYFLFLRYPEGIIYKHMPDYYSELLNIYRQLRPNTDEARLNLTITKVVNPLGNALNENMARIRKAFVEKFDEHLATNYIVTGERGGQYAIPLDRELITWEEN